MPIERKTKDRIGVMGHVIAGYPNFDASRQMIAAMVAAGVEIIEIQIPFTEPMADGPLFLAANHAAIKAGVTVEGSFELMQEVTQKYQVPFVFMTYANVVYRSGYERFVNRAVNAGAQGVIVPDLPVDYSQEFLGACRHAGFYAIPVVSPYTADERLSMIFGEVKEGLVYAVARAGVTGTVTNFGDELDDYLRRIRSHTELPVAVGFGVRTREDVGFLAGRADYAVIGSRGLEFYQEGGVKAAKAYWESVVQGNA